MKIIVAYDPIGGAITTSNGLTAYLSVGFEVKELKSKEQSSENSVDMLELVKKGYSADDLVKT